MIESDIDVSIAAHASRNAALLADLRRRGVDITRRQSVDHHFWAPDQQTAAQLAKKLYDRNYLILVLAPTDDENGSKVWNVEAGIQRTLENAASSSVTEELVRLGAEFNALYDGWGASV